MGQSQTLAPFPDPFVSSVDETPIGGALPLGSSTSLDANGNLGPTPSLNKLRTPLTPTPSPSI